MARGPRARRRSHLLARAARAPSVVGSGGVAPRSPVLPRRAVLLAAAALATAGCTARGTRQQAAPPPDPDVVLADEAAARERALLAAYDEAVARDPALAERLGPLRAEHAGHLASLGVPAVPAGPSDPTGAPSGGPAAGDATPAPPAVRPPDLPADPALILPWLAELERRASTAHAGAAVRAGRGTAVVLASLAASEAAHAAVLA